MRCGNVLLWTAWYVFFKKHNFTGVQSLYSCHSPTSRLFSRKKFWKSLISESNIASFPGLPPSPHFYLLFIFTRITQGAEEQQKTGKAWEHVSCEWCQVDMKVDVGGRGVGGGWEGPNCLNNALNHLFEFWTPDLSVIVPTWLVKTSLSSLVHKYLNIGPSPSLRPPHIHSGDECSLAFHFLWWSETDLVEYLHGILIWYKYYHSTKLIISLLLSVLLQVHTTKPGYPNNRDRNLLL